MNKSILIFLLALLGFALILCVSCYNQKQAAKQFGKAAATYPDIAATYCATQFPSQILIIKGDTITISDTVIAEGNVVTDTLIDFDTVRITTTKVLPGKVITTKTFIHDTITVENTARLKVCELERGKVIGLLASSNAESDKWQGKAKQRFWIMWALIIALGGSLYFNVRKMFT